MLTNEHIIEAALDRITAGYVFPEKTAAIEAAIRPRIASGAYEGLGGPELCETVTRHLQEVCPDKHLRLLWTDEPQSLEPVDDDGGIAAFLTLLRAENQGVHRVERLDGNVGLIELRRIATATEGAAAIGAAMQLVAHSTALVLDLRACLGGAPDGAALWNSFFFPEDHDQVHLHDVYDRGTDSTRQYWTSPTSPVRATRTTAGARSTYSPARSPSPGARTWHTPSRRTAGPWSSARPRGAEPTRRPGTRSPSTPS